MIRFAATYYDGATSRAHEVHVEQHGDVLRVVGGDVDVTWPLNDVRIAPRLGDTPRALTHIDGQKVQTRDNDAVDRLAEALGRGGWAAWRHRLEERWRSALGAVGVLAVLAVSFSIWGIPLVARVVAHATPDVIAYQLGQGTLKTLDGQLFEPSLLFSERHDHVRAVFDELAAEAPDLPLKLKFRRMGGIPNAFAMPDGTVVVTDAFLGLTDNDDELKAVLAHEIGHVAHRHGLRSALESSSLALLVSALLGDASQVTAVLSALPTIYAQAGYSRAHETEADTYALEFMERTGMSPRHFASIMTKLQQEVSKDHPGGEAPDAIAYLSSHPPTQDRIDRFNAAADVLEASGAIAPLPPTAEVVVEGEPAEGEPPAPQAAD